jgi:hypothetical protein
MAADPDPLWAELARAQAAVLGPQIEADAITRATERVREQLTARYAAALERALLEHLGRTPASRRVPSEPAQSEPAPPATESEDEALGWYLYAFAAGADATSLAAEPGVDPAATVEVVGDAELAAVGSPVRLSFLRAGQDSADAAPDGWLARSVLRHEEVVERAGDTVVPMRFGSVHPDREAVAGLLRRRRTELLDEITRLRGRAEWGVKVVAAADQPDADPVLAEARPTGSAYLRGKSEQRRAVSEAREVLREVVTGIHDTLADLAEAALVTPGQQPGRRSGAENGRVVLNASYLVCENRREDFAAAVQTLGVQSAVDGLDLRLSGPWPPYHFVSLLLTDGDEEGIRPAEQPGGSGG